MIKIYETNYKTYNQESRESQESPFCCFKVHKKPHLKRVKTQCEVRYLKVPIPSLKN